MCGIVGILDFNEKKIISELKPDDRFYTLHNKLELALSTKIIYNTKGLGIKK